MRTLGLIGGFTWHAAATYYRVINERVAERLGPFRSADLRLHSIDYGLVRQCRATNDWAPMGRTLVRAGRGLKGAGADAIVVASNTMHRFAPSLQAEVGLPVLHVADALADACARDGHQVVGLLGTAYTVQAPFLRERLARRGLDVRVSPAATVERLDHHLLQDLARGEVTEAARRDFHAAIAALAEHGATVAVLACTEIGLAVDPSTAPLPVLDSTLVHALAAADWALDDD